MNFANVKSLVLPEGEVAKVEANGFLLWKKQKKMYKTELAYLESTGTQYIDTNFFADDACGFEIKQQKATVDGDLISIGTCGTGDSRWCCNITRSGNFLSWNTANSIKSVVDTNDHVYSMNYLNDRKRCMDGVEYTPISTTLSANASMYPVALFGVTWRSATASAGSRWRGKIYYARITQGENVVRDFIPVLDWDDRPCMYDKVTGELFYNQGTGEFAYG